MQKKKKKSLAASEKFKAHMEQSLYSTALSLPNFFGWRATDVYFLT